MNKSKRPPLSVTTVLPYAVLGLMLIAMFVAMSKESEGYYLRSDASKPEPSVQELASLIPRRHEYNSAASLKLQDSPASDPAVRQQARELAKVWIHTFYTRMNNYTHEFCFVLVDKEKYSISAVTLAIRAFQANGYKVKLADSGFFYIVEISE